MNSTDLKDKTFEELERIVVDEFAQPQYLTRYIFQFVHDLGVSEISQISPLSKTFRQQLSVHGYTISQLKVVEELTDDEGTTKFILSLEDGHHIEAVLLPDDQRRTLCVSTQVGCAMNCLFCATGTIGLRRNLTAAEIADQVYTAQRGGERVSNVVYMGMGEPLNNYDAVLKSVRILNHPAGKNIGIRHLTISTCGIVPAIRKLAQEDIQPRLAISLNAPNDHIRTQLMPINKTYPLKALLDAVRDYQATTRQRVTFEYVMIYDRNDSEEHAQELVELLRGLKCNINLIQHNPHAGCNYAGSPHARMTRFASILKAAGMETTTRFRMGREIKAACGQLVAGYEAERPSGDRDRR